MANEFSITTATSRFTLDANRRGEVTVTVANTTNRPIQGRVQLEVSGGGKAEWFTVQGETTRTFAVAESAQYTVQSAVPAGTPPGDYTLRLNMVGVRNPDDEFSDGPGILFTVAATPVAAAPRKRFPWLYILIGAALVAVIAVVVLLMNRQPAAVATVAVPELSGQKVEDAEVSLNTAGLVVTRQDVANDQVAPGIVIGVEPAPGTSLALSSPVTLTVSSGPPLVTVPPDLIGKRAEEADTRLKSSGLNVDQTTESSLSVAQGLVIATDPVAGTNLPISSTVKLVVSSGPPMVVVPKDILGMTQADAETALQALGFSTATTIQAHNEIAEGLVISADPAPQASVPISSVINLVVSSGKEIVAVDDVVTLTLADAQKALTDLGLKVVVNPELNGTVDVGTVIRTEPAAGTSLRAGEPVTVVVSAPRPAAAPAGMVSFFEDTICPPGWQERPEMKGRLLLGTTDGSYAGKTSTAPALADQEDRQHSHSYNTNLALPRAGIAAGGGGNNDGGQAGDYPVSGTVNPSTSNLPFRQLLACEKKIESASVPTTGDAYPKDSVSYVTSEACPAGWEAYQAANGRFLLPLAAGGATADVGTPIALASSSVDIPPHSHRGLQFSFGIGDQSFILAGGSDRNLGRSGSYAAGPVSTGASTVQGQIPFIALMVCRKVADPQPTVDRIPAAALAFTEAPSCPTGWIENWNSRGRFLVALPEKGKPAEFGGQPLNPGEDRTHTHTATATLTLRGEGIAGASGCCTGGYARNGQYGATGTMSSESMNVPYRQLRLCKPNS